MKISFPGFKEEKKIFLALDIGSEAVKALIFKKNNEKITILGNSLEYFDRFGIFDSRDFEADVFKKTISKTLEEVAFEFGHSLSKFEIAFIGLPANILRGKVFSQFFERNQPKATIDKKEEEAIYQAILRDGQKKISQFIALETGILPREIQLVKTEILERKIDGYEVPKLQGFKGKQLEFRILFTFFPKYYLENFQRVFQDLNLKNFNFSHPAQNLTTAWEKPEGIFIDLGGELSQIFLVKSGKLEMVETFDIGGRAFSQILSENFGLDERRIRLLKERYSQGEISEGVRKRIKEIIGYPLQDWFRNLKLKLGEIKKIPLPLNIFLFGGGSQLPEIQEILTEGDWSNLPLIGQPEVKIIYPKDLKNIDDQTKKLNRPQEVPPLLLCYG